jgi:(p)ppGpp synthase/HD superfamily hydrolase
MSLANILDDIELERNRRLLGLLKPDPHALVLWSRAMASLPNDAERSRLAFALQFAKKIDYHHVGLTSEIYFSHPLRVSALALLISGSQDASTGVLGILHNVLEVTDVSLVTLSVTFGDDISRLIEKLTVDRKVQWEKTYKSDYYAKLMAGPLSARVVKIIDKLDNLFLLGLNPDISIREKYLEEIEDFVVPMAKTTLPLINDYLQELIKDCHLTGFIDHSFATNTKRNHESRN